MAAERTRQTPTQPTSARVGNLVAWATASADLLSGPRKFNAVLIATSAEYAEALQHLQSHILNLHDQVFEDVQQLDVTEVYGNGILSVEDMGKLFAWEALLRRYDFGLQAMEDWRRSIVEAAVHVEHATDMRTRLRDLVDSKERMA